MLKAQLHHSHLSFSFLRSFEYKPNFISLIVFWGGGGGGGFRSNYKSFILFSHLYLGVSIGCSHLKCKLNIFSNFLFSCKIYLNLYLKWAMTFRSPHFFFSFFLLRFFFFKKKKWPSFISTIKIFYLSHYKTHLECSLTSLILLISKVQTIFIFKWALPLVQVCY